MADGTFGAAGSWTRPPDSERAEGKHQFECLYSGEEEEITLQDNLAKDPGLNPGTLLKGREDLAGVKGMNCQGRMWHSSSCVLKWNWKQKGTRLPDGQQGKLQMQKEWRAHLVCRHYDSGDQHCQNTSQMGVDEATMATFLTLLIKTEHPSLATGLERAGLWDTEERHKVGRLDERRFDRALDEVDPGRQLSAAKWSLAVVHQEGHHPSLRTGEDSYCDKMEWGLRGGMLPEQGGTKFQPVAEEEARQYASLGAGTGGQADTGSRASGYGGTKGSARMQNQASS
eukprot:3865930-Rhodomonas_salina.1